MRSYFETAPGPAARPKVLQTDIATRSCCCVFVIARSRTNGSPYGIFGDRQIYIIHEEQDCLTEKIPIVTGIDTDRKQHKPRGTPKIILKYWE